jgi:superfamily II DNA or RNA helicase
VDLAGGSSLRLEKGAGLLRLAERPYQHAAIYGDENHPGIFKALREHRTTLLVLPTASGKTVVFSKVIEACVKRGKRVLVLAHREELIEGAHQKLIWSTSVDRMQIGIEMAGERAGDHHAVVLASVQTLQGERLRRIDASQFGLVVIDESHHARSKSYETIINHFPESKILGVTATPDRLDGKGLGKVFESVAYVYEIADAIRDGYLVRVVGEEIMGGSAIDLTDVRTTAGDLNQGDLAEVLERDPAVALVARGTVDRAGDLPTIIFAVSVAQARSIAEYINAYLGRPAAVALDGTAPREVRRDVKKRFEQGAFSYLVNCSLYTEGVDIPSIACVSIARPTQSRALYSQMVGRGLRLLGATIEESIAAGKDTCRVLDFSGVSGKHKLVTCFDVLDGNTDEEVRRRVIKRAESGPVDALEQLELVSREIVEEQRLRALRDVKYRAVAMADPFTVLGVHPRAGRYGGRPATLAQVEKLARHKIPGSEEQLRRMQAGQAGEQEPIDYGQAEQLLRAIGKRVREGKCSVRMAKILVKHGLSPDAPFEVAKWALDQIAGNRWRPTPEVLAHPELAAKA